MNSKFLRLTEELNALDYFEKAVSFIREAENSDIAWKWVILSLHGALYGFAISACQGASSDSVLEGAKARLTKELRRLTNCSDSVLKGAKAQQKAHLIGFNRAIERCETLRGGKALVLSPEERKSICALKEFLRDEFEHFKPCNRSFRLNGIANVALDCIRVTETLATATSKWGKLDRDQRQRIKKLAAEARTLLLNSTLYLDLQQAHSHSTLASFWKTTNLAT